MDLDRTAALRREHAEIVRFCRQLSDEEWGTPSAAPGWRVQDVVAHLGGSAKAIFTPTSVKLLTSKDIERSNDELVARRRDWAPARILAEFDQWGRRLVTLAGALSRTPVAALRLPLGELGRFPASLLLNSAFVFDQHTHLRYDSAPALGRPAPESDELRVSVVLEWMFAVLANQLRAARPAWLDRPIAISLSGPGGGRWWVGVDGGVAADPVGAGDTAAHIAGTAQEFPGWATTRTPWREGNVRIEGDAALAGALLDSMNVV